MKNENVLVIPNPSAEILLYALRTLPLPVVNSSAHLTCYGAGIVPPIVEQPTEDKVFDFLNELEPDFLPLSITYRFDPSTGFFKPTTAQITLKEHSQLATYILLGSRRIHTITVKMTGYDPTRTFNYQQLERLIPSAFDRWEDRVIGRGYTIGQLFLPFDKTQTGPHRGDDTPATALEYYGKELMLRNEYGVRNPTQKAAEWFETLKAQFTPDPDPPPF